MKLGAIGPQVRSARRKRRAPPLVARSSLRPTAASSCGPIVLLVAALAPAPAHEPIFGVGPETIFKSGLGIELGVRRAGSLR